MEDSYYRGLDFIRHQYRPFEPEVSDSIDNSDLYVRIVGIVCVTIVMVTFISICLYLLCCRNRTSEGVVYKTRRQPHMIANVGQEPCPA